MRGELATYTGPVKELGPATEDDMICAFVLAEMESDTFAPLIEPWLAQRGSTLPEAAAGLRAGEPHCKALARVALGDYRGYRRNAALFIGFPSDVTWRNVQLDQVDFEGMLYCSFPSWVTLSNGSRRVIDGASAAVGRDTKIDGIVADVRRGKRFLPIIAAQEPHGPLILVEGHNRATAFVVAQEFNVPAIIGSTGSLATWRWR